MKPRTIDHGPNIVARWSAIDDDTYGGHGSPMGWGATEAEAIADLKEQLERKHD